jgi:methionyl-tRNA formyltransferase
MRVAVAGTGRLGVAIMEPLLASPKHEVVTLMMNGRSMHGFARTRHAWMSRMLPKRESPVPWAIGARVPLLWLDTQSEAELAPIRALEPDLLITCGFSIILKPPLLAVPRIGCVNVHSSLLPKHRGPCPFNHVILAGDAESGVTFHVTAEGIDTGDILDQAAYAIEPADTAFAVYNKSCVAAGERVLAVLDRIEADGLAGVAQDASQASYDPKISAEAFEIAWERPAAELHRQFRSCMPYEQIYFWQDGKRVRVMRASFNAEPCDAPPGTVVRTRPGVTVATGAGTFTVFAGMSGRRVPMLWPMPWNRPAEGEFLA